MSAEDERPDGDADTSEAPPSKSARKRDAHASQALGEALIELTEPELVALGLPETLADAIRAARRIKSRGGLARQRQYIGKLMRAVDPAPLRAALAARHARAAAAVEIEKRADHWRSRLLAEGPGALAELAARHPQLPLAEWQRRVAAAQHEHARSGAVGAASRELFRALRALFATIP